MDAIKLLGNLLGENALGSKTGGNILGSLLGGAAPRGKAPSSAGQPADILSTLLGGKKGSGKGSLAALAAIAAAVAVAKGKPGGKAGQGGDWLGSLLGGAPGQGGLGELLGGLAGGTGTAKPSAGGGLGDLVGGLLGGGGAPGMGGLLGSVLRGAEGGGSETPPPLDPSAAEDEARLLIEAMCLAAKCDGRVDEEEREAIVGRLGTIEPDEAEFLRRNLSGTADVEAFARRVPRAMSEQVYAFSLMAVRLDSRDEAGYFVRLAQELGLDGETANGIHAKLGQPEIFA
jgi:uncharacterized membrane protein YebE (DUF533 family)